MLGKRRTKTTRATDAPAVVRQLKATGEQKNKPNMGGHEGHGDDGEGQSVLFCCWSGHARTAPVQIVAGGDHLHWLSLLKNQTA